MRMFGLVGLVLALLIVGVLAKKQMGSVVAPASSAPGVAGGVAPPSVTQGRQLQQEIQKSLDAAMQPRTMPDDNP